MKHLSQKNSMYNTMNMRKDDCVNSRLLPIQYYLYLYMLGLLLKKLLVLLTQ